MVEDNRFSYDIHFQVMMPSGEVYEDGQPKLTVCVDRTIRVTADSPEQAIRIARERARMKGWSNEPNRFIITELRLLQGALAH